MLDSIDVRDRFNEILKNVQKLITKDKYDEFDAKVNTNESNAHLIKRPPVVVSKNKKPIVQPQPVPVLD